MKCEMFIQKPNNVCCKATALEKKLNKTLAEHNIFLIVMPCFDPNYSDKINFNIYIHCNLFKGAQYCTKERQGPVLNLILSFIL